MARFFVEPGDMAGEYLTLTGDNAQHAKVLRLKQGEEVLICDGQGGECVCVVEDVIPSVTMRILERRTSASEAKVQVSVYMAFPKGDKLVKILDKFIN